MAAPVERITMPIAIVVIVLVLLAVGGISIYNGIVTKRNRCDNAWQTIETQLQRRNDLNPNLVETVKGYASHESETLAAVTAARAASTSATTPGEVAAAENQVMGALRQLLVVAEAYPDLKANANFQQLQSDLTDTENKISYARQSYNDCVLTYNNAIQTFPGNLVAGFGHFEPKQGFIVEDEAARKAPKVQF